jgi:tetratricopeptide (TPR) repeat protein
VSAMPPYPRRLSVYGLSLLLAGLSLSLRAEPDLSTVQTFLQQTRFHQAEQALEIAFAQEKKNELYYTIKGMVASKRANFADAENNFKKALLVAPLQGRYLFNLAELYYLQGKYDLALEQYLLIRDDSLSRELLEYKVILCYLLTGKAKEARSLVTKVKLDPQTPYFYYVHAAWAFADGRVEEGRYFAETAGKLYLSGNELFRPSLVEQGWLEH